MPLNLTRSLLVILLPGFVMMLPFFIAFLQIQEVRSTLAVASNLDLAIAFAITVIFGSLLEAAASRIEVCWDKKTETQHLVEKYWFDYLAYCEKGEPVGFRYISRLATTMYFELSMSIALPLSSVGFAFILAVLRPESWCPLALGYTAISLLLGWLLFRSARDTHEVLCRARRQLMDRLNPPNPSSVTP
jgi:hypothetical protein